MTATPATADAATLRQRGLDLLEALHGGHVGAAMVGEMAEI